MAVFWEVQISERVADQFKISGLQISVRQQSFWPSKLTLVKRKLQRCGGGMQVILIRALNSLKSLGKGSRCGMLAAQMKTPIISLAFAMAPKPTSSRDLGL